MPFSTSLIDPAVARYERERDRYLKLAVRVAEICQAVVVEGDAVRAQVTSRTKTPQSFRGKLERFSRQDDKNYASVDEIFEGVTDFAGVRVATYSPEHEGKVTQRLCELFSGPEGASTEVHVDAKNKLDPERARFYRATHCQVHLREEDLVGSYENLRGASCEVQVCSMMAHVWNEIEHDIGYKPEGGGPGPAEMGLLEALGHLTRSGDASITRLLEANELRLQSRQGEFSDVHDFVARLRDRFPEADLSVNAGQAYDAAQRLGIKSPDAFEGVLGAALDAKSAKLAVREFNQSAIELGRSDARLNIASADLITVMLLPSLAKIKSEDRSDTAGRLKSGRLAVLLEVARDISARPIDPERLAG
ncbi:MAG: hypothetical protein EOP62_11850 [Sphingomonadales bacterium]|nr:MAG: hypothetical protein EOP62_11850 [Sphingomonadales bacterium]